MNLQDAQDDLQRLGRIQSQSRDATGEGRLQILDREWIIVDQLPVPRHEIEPGGMLFLVVMRDEPHGCPTIRVTSDANPVRRGEAQQAITTTEPNGSAAEPAGTNPPQAARPTTKPAPATLSPTTAPQAEPQSGGFSDGEYQVGRDISAGTYRTRRAPDSTCYWERKSGFGGTGDEIIANDLSNGPTVVTISSSDAGFESNRCGFWSEDLSQITSSKSSFGEGTYIVGTDMAPGTYRSNGTGTCYWARLSGFGGTGEEIIANDLSDGPAIASISATDKGFESSRCGTWTKQ